MKKGKISYTVDLNNLPPLTVEQQAELKALAEKPDGEIDFSDIPRLTPEFFKHAVRNPFYKPTKTSTTIRIDSDVLAWLQVQRKGYQSRLNAILRKEMLASLIKMVQAASIRRDLQRLDSKRALSSSQSKCKPQSIPKAQMPIRSPTNLL